MSDGQIAEVVRRTAGYSGSDLAALCREAALGPIRDFPDAGALLRATESDVRAIDARDFAQALTQVRPTVSEESVRAYEKWNATFGSTVGGL